MLLSASLLSPSACPQPDQRRRCECGAFGAASALDAIQMVRAADTKLANTGIR